MEKKSSRQVKLRLLRGFMRGSVKYFALCIFTGFLLTACDMLIPQIIRFSVDSVIGTAEPELPARLAGWLAALGGIGWLRANPWLTAVLIGAAGLCAAALRYAYHVTDSQAGETLVKTIRDTLYTHIQRLPWSWHQANATGDIIQRCTSDVDVIKNFCQDQLVSVFRIVVILVFSLVCMASISWRLTLIIAAIAPVIILYSLLFQNSVRERFTLCDANEGILSTIAQENLTGVRVVRAFGRESFERDRFEAQNQIYTELWVRLCHTLSWFWASADITTGVQNLLVLVLGCVLCVRGEISSGDLIAFLVYNAMLIWPVRRLGRVLSEMSKAGVSLERLAYIIDSPAEADPPGATEPELDRDIAFEHVSFRYGDDGPEVLSDVSFTVPAHCSFGILGGTGSGKTSLMHLLCRLYEPTAGRITVGGEDIAGMKAGWVREHMGIVLQEPFLFSRSIGENIGICGGTAEEIRVAAATACVDADIRGFSAGYDTLVGERGVTLSGGQKQRVAMARMLSKKPPVVIFDDSLSAVDTETDEHIRDSLARDLGGATRLIISHRITTLTDCDLVLVLEHGRVAQLGSPRELYEQPGIYRRVYNMQMALGEEE